MSLQSLPTLLRAWWVFHLQGVCVVALDQSQVKGTGTSGRLANPLSWLCESFWYQGAWPTVGGKVVKDLHILHIPSSIQVQMYAHN